MSRRFALLAGAVALALAAPATSLAIEQADDGGPADEQADEVADELSDAVRTLEEVEAQIERAEQDLAAAERRLQRANNTLEGLERDIAAAQRALAAAEATVDTGQLRLEAAEDELARAAEAQAAAFALLQDRSVEIFKYGTGPAQRTLVTGLAGANDLHDLAFTSWAMSRIVRSDQELLGDAEVARDGADDARARAAAARQDARAAQRQAAAEQLELAALLDAQKATVAEVERDLARREEILDELREDSQVTEVLVSMLADELAHLEAIAAAPPPPPEPAALQAAPLVPDGQAQAPAWSDRLPPAGRPWAAQIDAAARANRLDGRLLAALVWTESGFDPTAVSWAGAIGLTQLMPATAAQLGVDPWDPDDNLRGGAHYLATQFATFGTVELALAAYNAGPKAVAAAGPGIPDNVQTPLHVVRVLERYNRIAG